MATLKTPEEIKAAAAKKVAADRAAASKLVADPSKVIAKPGSNTFVEGQLFHGDRNESGVRKEVFTQTLVDAPPEGIPETPVTPEVSATPGQDRIDDLTGGDVPKVNRTGAIPEGGFGTVGGVTFGKKNGKIYVVGEEDIPKTEQQLIDEENRKIKAESFEEDKSSLERQIETARKNLERQETETKSRTDRAKAGASSTFAEGRGGVTTGSASQISQQFRAGFESQGRAALDRIASSRAALKDKEAKLAIASRSQDTELRQDLQDQVDQLQNKIAQDAETTEEFLESAENKVIKANEAFTKNIIDTFGIDAFAKLDATGIMSAATNMGADPLFALGMHDFSREYADAKDDEEKGAIVEAMEKLFGDTSLKELDATQSKIAISAGLAALVANKGITQEDADKLKLDAGIGEKPLTALEQAELEGKEINNKIEDLKLQEAADLVKGSETIIDPGANNPYLGKQGGSLTFRTNNPGAITPKSIDQANRRAIELGAIPGLYSLDKTGGYVLNFKTEQEGWDALDKLLDEGYSSLTLSGVAEKWTGGAGAGHKKQFTERGLELDSIYGNLSDVNQKKVAEGISFVERGGDSYKGEDVDPTKTMNTGRLTQDQKLLAGVLAVKQFGKIGGNKPEKIKLVEDLMRSGKTVDDIEDMIKESKQSEALSGAFEDASRSLSVNLSSDKREVFLDEVDRLLSDDRPEDAKDFVRKQARQEAGVDAKRQIAGKERTIEFLEEIGGDLKAFRGLLGGTGLISGSFQKALEKAGQTGNAELVRIGTKLDVAVQNYRKAMTGAQFSVPESEEYKAIFPSISKMKNLNTAKVEALRDTLTGDVDLFYEQALGEKAYNSLYKSDELDITTPEGAAQFLLEGEGEPISEEDQTEIDDIFDQ